MHTTQSANDDDSTTVHLRMGRKTISLKENSSPPQTRKTSIVHVFGALVACCIMLAWLQSAHGGDMQKKMTPASFLPHKASSSFKNNSNRGESPFLLSLCDTLRRLTNNRIDSMENRCAAFIDSALCKDSLIVFSARVPKGRPFEWLAWKISQTVYGTSYMVSDCIFDDKKQQITVVFLSGNKKDPAVRTIVSRSERFQSGFAKMALIGEVVDDSAYQTIVAFLSNSERLCISLLPGNKQSPLIAQIAEKYHKEIIIRMPLEPVMKIPSDFYGQVIMVHYSKDDVRSLLSQAIKSVPHFAGFINMWGSRALEDSRLMAIFFTEIKKEHAFFIENKTAKNSIASSIAKKIGLPYEETNGAILEKHKQTDIEKQMKNFCVIAQINGTVLITAPITPTFIKTFKTLLPWIKQNGISLVFASEIVKSDPY